MLIISSHQLVPLTGQALLVGYLSQYFCEKKGLDEELSVLRAVNDSRSITAKEKEIEIATRDAYFYAVGMMLASLVVAVVHAWAFYLAHKIGMLGRLIVTGAIYTKVHSNTHTTHMHAHTKHCKEK